MTGVARDDRSVRAWATLSTAATSADPDLASAEALAPGCRHEIVGVRPGEKLHEVMIPYDEARNALEYDAYFVIQPQFEWWSAVRDVQDGGKALPEGFSYRSDNNTQWLEVEALRALAEGLA